MIITIVPSELSNSNLRLRTSVVHSWSAIGKLLYSVSKVSVVNRYHQHQLKIIVSAGAAVVLKLSKSSTSQGKNVSIKYSKLFWL